MHNLFLYIENLLNWYLDQENQTMQISRVLIADDIEKECVDILKNNGIEVIHIFQVKSKNLKTLGYDKNEAKRGRIAWDSTAIRCSDCEECDQSKRRSCVGKTKFLL